MSFDSNDITAKNKDNIDKQAKIKNRQRCYVPVLKLCVKAVACGKNLLLCLVVLV